MEKSHTKQSFAVSDHSELNSTVLEWKCPVQDSVKYPNDSVKWYTFLNSLYCRFSQYDIQISKRKYNVADIEDWGKEDVSLEDFLKNEVKEIEINRSNFEIFLSKIQDYDIAEYDNIRNITVINLQLEELNNVLDLTIKSKLHLSCNEPYILIKGNYIIFSEINSYIAYYKGFNQKMDESCKDALLTNKVKFVNMFALSTLYIDSELTFLHTEFFKKVNVSVIAPKWEIIGKQKLELKGEDGEFPEIGLGLDGKSGKPGKPSGNFFGIGNEFINGTNLEISVKGGDGSPGQEGKNGQNGIQGSTSTVPSDNYCSDRLCDNNERINGYKCEKINCQYSYQSRLAGTVKWTDWCIYKIFGKSGTEGKNGGKGGKGGKSGYPGSIVLIELNDQSDISICSNSGLNGTDGRGGIGGIGGKRGNDIFVKCQPTYWRSYWYSVNSTESHERAVSGQNGADGASLLDLKNPEKAADTDNLDKAKIINLYKSYLREHLNNQFTRNFLSIFLKQLVNNANVQSVYDTLGLIDDFIRLEEQFPNLNEVVNFLPFYKSLLNRIRVYAEKLKEVADPKQHKMVLGYLYTATLGRIHNLEDDLESDLIMDITAYFKSVKEDIEKLKHLQTSKYKEELINKYKEDYKSEIDKKIEEAKEIISKELILEIHNIGTSIDTQMQTLVNEMVYLQDEARIDHDKLVEKQQQLEKMLLLQGFFSSFKILGQILNLLGPAGSVAASVIEIGSAVPDSFILNNLENQDVTLELPQSLSDIQTINRGIKFISKQKYDCFKNTLESVAEEINKNQDILGTIYVKIADIKDRFEKMEDNWFNFREIESLGTELKAALQLQEGDLINTEESVKIKKVSVIDNLKKIVRLNTEIFDFYNQYKNDRNKLDILSDAIIQLDLKLQSLEKYKQKIYYTTMPMLQNIKNDLDNIISKLDTKSKVALDVTKWHVKNTLRDMILFMKEETQKLPAENDLARCIEKMKDAIVTLINVHDHIKDYQKDQHLATFIADVSSITVADINVINPKLEKTLRDAVRDLEIAVTSNIVIQRYKVAMNAFKQFIFPFAHKYLKDLILPMQLQLKDTDDGNPLDNLISRAVIQIENIYSKLEEYKITVKKRDGCIGKGEFTSGYVSIKPFFVWENNQYNNIISKLLSGQEVILNADIKKSAPYKDAIKFSVVNFQFKSKNETVQTGISDKLNSFQLTATHLGNSYYRYDGKVYQMTTVSQDIWYHFEKNHETGEPLQTSISYDKIKSGNFTLSPYASWKLQLDIVADSGSFNELEIYKDSVYLELQGYGYYLNKKSRNCEELEVDRYYKEFTPYSQDDSLVESNGIYEQTELKDNTHKRFTLEINQDINDDEYITETNPENENHGNSNIKSSSWFSWMRLPNFSILPGAEASNIAGRTIRNLKEPGFKDNTHKRFTLEINQDINDEEYITEINPENENHVNANTKSSGWFSWIRLPNFSILPGAEATNIAGSTIRNLEEPEFSKDDIIMKFSNHVKSFKDLFLSKLSKHTDCNTNSDETQKISNNWADYILNGDNTKSPFNPAIEFHDNESNDIQEITSFDVHGNLALGHLVTHAIFGKNESLSCVHYVSPEQERIKKLNDLASDILPIINNNSLYDYSFAETYKSAPQWYRELCKDIYEETLE